MKKKAKKMTLSKETLRMLEDKALSKVEGAFRTIDRTNCYCTQTVCRNTTCC
jgi:hypothetical protein